MIFKICASYVKANRRNQRLVFSKQKLDQKAKITDDLVRAVMDDSNLIPKNSNAFWEKCFSSAPGLVTSGVADNPVENYLLQTHLENQRKPRILSRTLHKKKLN